MIGPADSRLSGRFIRSTGECFGEGEILSPVKRRQMNFRSILLVDYAEGVITILTEKIRHFDRKVLVGLRACLKSPEGAKDL
ncbi:MAG: hypothetical protein KIT57_14730 [Blastocatellales bacterium]|nr:hypothetical protein [Blastocatellales bacterium]